VQVDRERFAGLDGLVRVRGSGVGLAGLGGRVGLELGDLPVEGAREVGDGAEELASDHDLALLGQPGQVGGDGELDLDGDPVGLHDGGERVEVGGDLRVVHHARQDRGDGDDLVGHRPVRRVGLFGLGVVDLDLVGQQQVEAGAGGVEVPDPLDQDVEVVRQLGKALGHRGDDLGELREGRVGLAAGDRGVELAPRTLDDGGHRRVDLELVGVEDLVEVLGEVGEHLRVGRVLVLVPHRHRLEEPEHQHPHERRRDRQHQLHPDGETTGALPGFTGHRGLSFLRATIRAAACC
jgi:hypothetical protein